MGQKVSRIHRDSNPEPPTFKTRPKSEPRFSRQKNQQGNLFLMVKILPQIDRLLMAHYVMG